MEGMYGRGYCDQCYGNDHTTPVLYTIEYTTLRSLYRTDVISACIGLTTYGSTMSTNTALASVVASGVRNHVSTEESTPANLYGVFNTQPLSRAPWMSSPWEAKAPSGVEAFHDAAVPCFYIQETEIEDTFVGRPVYEDGLERRLRGDNSWKRHSKARKAWARHYA